MPSSARPALNSVPSSTGGATRATVGATRSDISSRRCGLLITTVKEIRPTCTSITNIRLVRLPGT